MRCLLVNFVLWSLTAQAQPSDIQILVPEVRSLRAALDRTAQIALNAQVIVYRIGWQQHALAEANRCHKDAVTAIEGHLNQVKWRAQQVQQIENDLAAIENQHRKAILAKHLESLKKSLEYENGREQELRTGESESSHTVRVEEAKLEELKKQLELLERTVARTAN